MIRHSPPCTDPGCDSCWWDALDQEWSRGISELAEERRRLIDPDPLLHWADGLVMTLSDYLDHGLAQDQRRARLSRLKTRYARRRNRR